MVSSQYYTYLYLSTSLYLYFLPVLHQPFFSLPCTRNMFMIATLLLPPLPASYIHHKFIQPFIYCAPFPYPPSHTHPSLPQPRKAIEHFEAGARVMTCRIASAFISLEVSHSLYSSTISLCFATPSYLPLLFDRGIHSFILRLLLLSLSLLLSRPFRNSLRLLICLVSSRVWIQRNLISLSMTAMEPTIHLQHPLPLIPLHKCTLSTLTPLLRLHHYHPHRHPLLPL